MESLEVSAKTVEEAIDLGLKQLDAERAEVDVVVVGQPGLPGERLDGALAVTLETILSILCTF